MITVDRARRGTAARRKRALAQMAGLAFTSALVLAGCTSAGPADGYIEAYYDNGQPIRSPLKDTLFDEAGAPLCATPIYQGRVETRFRSFSDNGGVMNAFLFEVLNDEQDPNAPLGELDIPSGQSEAQYRETLRRQQGSLPRMYQLTHPFLFDPEFGVSGPDDMAPIKEDLRADLPNLVARTAGITQFIVPGDAWVESSAGRFEVGNVGDVEVFMETLGITGVPYDGLNNDYFSAMKDGEQFLMIRNRESGVVTLVNDKGEADIDEIQQFQQYDVLAEPGFPESVAARFTLQNDGCPQHSGDNFARWWITNIEPVAPAPEEEEDDPFATDDDDPFATDDEPSPSPSPTAAE
jgi:hypothetical protein